MGALKPEKSVLMNLVISTKLIEAMEKAVKNLGYQTKSEFIRRAIVEKLLREGIDVPLAAARISVPVRKSAAPSPSSSSIDAPPVLQEPAVEYKAATPAVRVLRHQPGGPGAWLLPRRPSWWPMGNWEDFRVRWRGNPRF
jgi:Arc/MetJ-type ribon-helix-helix transcriptional regulator